MKRAWPWFSAAAVLWVMPGCSDSARNGSEGQVNCPTTEDCTNACTDTSCDATPAAGGATSGATQSGGSGGSLGTGNAGMGAGTATGGAAQTVCGQAEEGESLTLECPASLVVGDVEFASYGNPDGSCNEFVQGDCHADASANVVEALCQGRSSCSITASNGRFSDPCSSVPKRLAVETTCVKPDAVSSEGQPFKGVANSPCAVRQALDVSWYYDWTRSASDPCESGGGEFVPMVWGHPGDERNASAIASMVAGFVDAGHEHVLAFNEPDNPDQANIPVGEAMELFPAFDQPGIEVGSPATAANANPGQTWFTDFMSALNASSEARADFLAIHWYGWNEGSCDPDAAQLESYIEWAEAFEGDRPIWITEFGCLNESAPDQATVVEFFRGALAVFARHPRIERYAWYPWSENCNLADDEGNLTDLGVEYAKAPPLR